MKTFKAVLFDFDGVLADTMEDNFQAWKQSFQEKGVEIRRKDYFSLEGMQLKEIAKTISKKYNINPNPEEIVKKKNVYYLQYHSFRFYSGINKLIDKLKERNKLLAIVSASPKEKLCKTVPTEFLKKFDVVTSGNDVKNGKPNPESYLTTLKKLNIKPEEGVVIENAPLGIKSAKAAGTYCIALTTTLDKNYLQEANKIINNHEELERLLLN